LLHSLRNLPRLDDIDSKKYGDKFIAAKHLRFNK